jgi:peptidoglycan/xylan/chitin deacetylase (PgdA/CDA1 family)
VMGQSRIALALLGVALASVLAAAGRGPKVPTLTYHHVRDIGSDDPPTLRSISCSREGFVSHLAWLGSQGFEAVTFVDLQAFLGGGAPLPPRPVILTFDDGYDDNWFAFEELKRRGMRGVFFVVTSALGTPGRLSREQLRSMAEAGMEIGSHSATHVDLRGLRRKRQMEEALGSKRALEDLLGRPVISFCYPGGASSGATASVLQEAGYWFARTTAVGVSRVAGRNFEMSTLTVRPETGPAELARGLKVSE